MELENIFFKSDLFEIEQGEDEETNPRMYGRQLSNWLRKKLIEKGYEVEEVIPEDWGWCVMCAREPFMLWVGCSSLTDYETAKEDDPPPETEKIIWSCFVTAEVSFFKSIFKKINTEPSLLKLSANLEEIINSEKRITVINEP